MARVVVAAGADTGEETPGRIYLPQRLAKPRLAGDGATAHLAGHPPAGVSPLRVGVTLPQRGALPLGARLSNAPSWGSTSQGW